MACYATLDYLSPAVHIIQPNMSLTNCLFKCIGCSGTSSVSVYLPFSHFRISPRILPLVTPQALLSFQHTCSLDDLPVEVPHHKPLRAHHQRPQVGDRTQNIGTMSALHRLFDIQPASNVANPEPTYQKSKARTPQTLNDVGILPDAVELNDFARGKNDVDSQKSASERGLQKGFQTPKTPNELEMSRPPTPTRDDAVGLIRTWNSDPMTKWRILCCCSIYFSNGMNDSGE